MDPFMSHNYVQQLVHVIWSTKNQQFQIPIETRNALYAYISTVIKSKGGKLYLAGGHDDHIHCLISIPPSVSISTMIRFIKTSSSKWIKHQNCIDPEFSWQDGYTAIGIQDDRIDAVCKYIKGEVTRHPKIGYKEELSNILKLQNISFEEKYLLTNTHSKVFVHMIWSTKNRMSFLEKSIRPSLYEKLSVIISEGGNVVHAIGGVEDHVHLLVDVSRNMQLSELVGSIKAKSTHWLSGKADTFRDFEWQAGFGGFSISSPTADAVKTYIAQQEEHHKQTSSAHEWNNFVLKKGLV
jgi:putative transposase